MKISCLFGHKWDGCTCLRCGTVRDEAHHYEHFMAESDNCIGDQTGKCVGTCKCGKKQELEHDWDGCKCRRCGIVHDEGHDWVSDKCSRCGMRYEDSYEHAVRLMDEKDYISAIRCFEKITHRQPNPINCSHQIFECMRLEYEEESAAIARNDYAYFNGMTTVAQRLYSAEASYYKLFKHKHPHTDKLMEQVYAAIIKCYDEADFDSARKWFSKISYVYKGTDPVLNHVIFQIALLCLEKKEYHEAKVCLSTLPANYPQRDAMLAACDARTPSTTSESCPDSPDGAHHWHDTDIKTIDSETRKAGYTISRCEYCGKEIKKDFYDYDTDGY